MILKHSININMYVFYRIRVEAKLFNAKKIKDTTINGYTISYHESLVQDIHGGSKPDEVRAPSVEPVRVHLEHGVYLINEQDSRRVTLAGWTHTNKQHQELGA